MSWGLIDKARKTLAGEEGTIIKSWGGKITFAIAYPNIYYVGMSNLGFHTIYYQLNSFPDVLCERVFLPDKDDYQAHIYTNTALFTLESQKNLYRFNIVAFSVSFENDYLNILKMLDLAKIPLEREKRDDHYPLIIAGGVASSLNPEPISNFIDLFVIGEGEEVIPELIDSYKTGVEEGFTKDEILENLADVAGIYVPRLFTVKYNSNGTIKGFEAERGFPQQVKRRWVKGLDDFNTHSIILTPNTEFGDMFLIEMSRGCGWRCRFCAIGSIYHPYRRRSFENLIETATSGVKKMGKIGLVGANVSDHPELAQMCEFIVSNEGNVSLSSLRADSINTRVIRSLKASGHKTLTLAPEAGSDRLRRVIDKKLTERDILKVVETVIANDILNLKLYFMIGLPTETLEDVEEIVRMARRIRHHVLKMSKDNKRLGKITLSINSFVPKPVTPFQWHPFDDKKSLKDKLKVIRNALKKESNINVICDLPKWSYIQALLSKGDRRVGGIILAAYRFGGDWKRAFREVDINPDFYVYRQREIDEVFPWDFINHGIGKEDLFSEYKKALSTPSAY